jgi:predicted O-methyltransferase YrrM
MSIGSVGWKSGTEIVKVEDRPDKLMHARNDMQTVTAEVRSSDGAGSVKERLRNLVKALPVFGKPYVQREELRQVVNQLWFLPGHFYSPIPSLEDVRQHAASVFDTTSRTVAGVDLNEDSQVALFRELARYYPDEPFARDRQPGLRFHLHNPAFTYCDAILYYCMLRHVRPRRVIEVGSGYSSCLLLDTNERAFRHAISCTFIEPYPKLLHSLISDDDRARIRVIPTNVQEVPAAVFDELAPDDILFIDSSHVSKTHSDVNYLFFEILPRLQSGVYVHVHDVFFPFEYPREWVFQGRAWNEAYLVRAFLQYNDRFEIQLFNSFLETFHRDLVAELMPLCTNYVEATMAPTSAQSLWLRKR